MPRTPYLDIAIDRRRFNPEMIDRIPPLAPAAPPPAPTPPPPIVLSPRLFLAEFYALSSYPGDMGRGEVIGTYNLLPGEEQEFYVMTRRVSESTTQITTSVAETRDQKAVEDLNTSVKQDDTASHVDDKYDYHMDASFRGDASWSPLSGDVSADLNVHGGSNSVRDEFKNAVSSAVNKQVSKTDEFRKQRMSSRSDGSVETNENVASTKRTIKNADPLRTANYVFYQLSQEYISMLSLVDVKIGFSNGDPRHDRLLPLSRLDSLLNDVIAKPDDRDNMRKLVYGELQAVFDYQGTPRNVLRRQALVGADGAASAQGYSQFDPDLKSSYDLMDSSGAVRRTIVTKGVIINVDRRVLPTANIAVSTLYEG